MDSKSASPFFYAARPFHLLTSLFAYGLGVGIANYLGWQIRISFFILGLIWILSLQIGGYFLGEYLDSPLESGWFPRPPYTERPEIQVSKVQKPFLLYSSAILLALTAALTVLFSLSGLITLPVSSFMITAALAAVIPDFPAVHRILAGLRELINSFGLVVVTPILGFGLQTGELHHFLLWSSFFLFCLHAAVMIVFQLPLYADDLRNDRASIVTFLGWRRGIQFHHVLLIGAFYLAGMMALFGIPLQLVGPLFLSLPFATFQTWYLIRITRGAPVKWNLLLINAGITFGFSLYLMNYIFWTR